MRKRVHRVANFLAFNLLFFALYLNFIYKDPAAAVPASARSQHEPAAFSVSLTEAKSETSKHQSDPAHNDKNTSGKDTH